MASKALKAIVFMGSTRDGRNADRVAKFMVSKLKEAKYDVELWDPKELNLPMLKQPLNLYPDPSKAPQQIRDLNEKIKAADAFVLLAPEYNRQLPPALTNIIDYFPPISFAWKTSGIVCYSAGRGGMNAAAQARTLMVEMGAPPIPFILHIESVMKEIDESGTCLNEYFSKSAEKMIVQLSWFAGALRNQREKDGAPAWDGTVVAKWVPV